MRLESAVVEPGEYPGEVARLRSRCFPRWYQEGSHRGTLLYRAHDERLVGYLIIHVAGAVAYVEELAVDPPARGRGVARSLIHRAGADLAGSVERLAVFPMTGSGSESRRGVFVALGFRPSAEHPNMLEAPPVEL